MLKEIDTYSYDEITLIMPGEIKGSRFNNGDFSPTTIKANEIRVKVQKILKESGSIKYKIIDIKAYEEV